MKSKVEKTVQTSERIHLRQIDRLRKIHLPLSSKEFPSTKHLAESLEVHPRTVRRYIAFMRDSLNAPIRFDKEKNGFYYTHQNWEMPLVSLTEGELLAFFIATIATQGKGAAYEDDRLNRAIAKIAAWLPEAVSVNLGYLFENTTFQAPPHVLVEGEILDKLHKAISEREIVRFDYSSTTSGATKNRRAEPQLLHNHEGTWYAVAFDYLRQGFIVFHTGRISNLEPTGDFFKPRKYFDKEKYIKDSFGMYHGGKPAEVEIVFDAYQSKWMRERNFFHPNETREDLPDGSLKLSFTIGENALEAVARFCLQYAGNCIAEKPDKLREIIKEKLNKALEMNR